MFPNSSHSDVGNESRRYAKRLGKHAALLLALGYLKDLLLRKFCRVVFGSHRTEERVPDQDIVHPALNRRRSIASLSHRVVHVVAVSSDKQMSGVGAWRIVTFMKDKKAIGNLADVLFIRIAVGVGRVVATSRHLAVTRFTVNTSPSPASIFISNHVVLKVAVKTTESRPTVGGIKGISTALAWLYHRKSPVGMGVSYCG